MAREFTVGNSEYLSSATTPVTGAPFSFSAWFMETADPPAANAAIFSIGDSASGSELFLLYVNVTSNLAYFVQDGSGFSQPAPQNVTADIWNHAVAVEAAADDRSCYLNGSKQSDTNSVTPTSQDRITIGAAAVSGFGNYWDGRIAEAGLWNVALTDDEINILAAGYSPLFVRPQNLVAYWPLIRDEDQDRVGGYDMTPVNTPTVAAHPPIIYPAPTFDILWSAAAPPDGLVIPTAMHQYRQRRL